MININIEYVTGVRQPGPGADYLLLLVEGSGIDTTITAWLVTGQLLHTHTHTHTHIYIHIYIYIYIHIYNAYIYEVYIVAKRWFLQPNANSHTKFKKITNIY